MDSIERAVALIVGVCSGLGALWKLYRAFQKDIEAPLRAELAAVTAERDRYREKLLQHLQWDGAERREPPPQ
jgi:hypothetical protein